MIDTKTFDHSAKPLELSGFGTAAHLSFSLVLFSHLALLILLYGQTFSFNYVFFDDTEYILETPEVLSGLNIESIQWAFTSFHMNNWHPLTWISHMLDASLFGTDPGWAHLHNVLIHGANSILVFVILAKLLESAWRAYILSIIFLIHPLHVESVAWIAERKDVLCAFFFLGGMIMYDHYRQRPGRFRYLGVLTAYTLALLAKPMAVTFPVILLILDIFVYCEKDSIKAISNKNYTLDLKKAVLEKLPLIALSLAACVVTILAQDTAVMQIKQYAIESRLINSVNAYAIYLRQFFIPIDLIVYYPLPTSLSVTDIIFSGTSLVILGLIAIFFISKLPLIATGLCFYLVALLPVIGIVQVGNQAHADRYMYLPSLGVLIACSYLIPSIGGKYFKLGRAISILFIIYLSFLCYWQVSYWKDRHTLFSRALDVSDENYMAQLQIAGDYWSREMLDKSREHLLKAISIRPELPDAYMPMGNIALAEKEFQAAEKLYELARSVGMNSAELQNNLGVALAEQGRLDEAINAFQMALEIEPESRKARENLELYTVEAFEEPTP